MNESFANIKSIISSRRTTKPPQMNGRKIADEQIQAILELANYAPTHGLTEPWRFVVYSGDKVDDFCIQHASLYKANTSTEKFETAKYDKLLHMGDKASHIIIAIMQRGRLPKINIWEEKAAVASAVQNMLLGATALEIATYWGSGGMAQHVAMKDFLSLNEADFVMGILYFGYSDKQPPFTRSTPINEKIRWNPS
ncbi:hypothetical protein BH10BAC3_BH10BAC3_40620 [soil metagenome]